MLNENTPKTGPESHSIVDCEVHKDSVPIQLIIKLDSTPSVDWTEAAEECFGEKIKMGGALPIQYPCLRPLRNYYYITLPDVSVDTSDIYFDALNYSVAQANVVMKEKWENEHPQDQDKLADEQRQVDIAKITVKWSKLKKKPS